MSVSGKHDSKYLHISLIISIFVIDERDIRLQCITIRSPLPVLKTNRL